MNQPPAMNLLKENTSGFFFRAHLASGGFNHNELVLAEPIDTDILARAWRCALDDCPFFEQALVNVDDRLYFAPHACACEVGRTPLEEGTDEAKSADLAWVAARDRSLWVGVSHALTDEFGKKVFTELVLYHYFRLKDNTSYPHPYAGVAFDGTTDMLHGTLFDAEPLRRQAPDAHFVAPEHLEAAAKGGSQGRAFRLSLDAREFFALCREAFPLDDAAYEAAQAALLPIGRIQCLFAYLALGRAIQHVHPENAEPITLRCPVNVRALTPSLAHVLTNCSLPQAAVGLPASCFGADLTEKVATRLIADMVAELSPAEIARQLEALAERAMGAPALAGDVLARYGQSMIVSNVGREYWEPTSGRIVDDIRNATGGYPLALYLNRVQGRQLITLSQSFDSPAYFDALVGVFEDLEAASLATERV